MNESTNDPLVRYTEKIMVESNKINDEGQGVYQKLTRDYLPEYRN